MSDITKPNYDRNSKPSFEKKENRDADSSIEMLIKKGLSDHQAYAKLRKSFPNDEEYVKKTFDLYKQRLVLIERKSRKFKQLLINKYSNLPLHELMEKAKKFAKKYDFSDDEFTAFFNKIVNEPKYSNSTYNKPSGKMSQVFGYDQNEHMGDSLVVKNNEMDVLQDILKLYSETRVLHAQVMIQSLQFQELQASSLVGSFVYGKHNQYSYIHPVIAALFLIKIPCLEDRMLIANIGHIIKNKYENKPITTNQEFEMYWSIITDPNEVSSVSNKDSPMVNLRNRFIVQTKIWDSVLQLRQGKYYNERVSDFLIALDNCDNNLFDSPDMAYVKDEGTILRRMLGAFSMRPTFVSVRPYNNNFGQPGFAGNYNVSTMSLTRMTSIPIITIRIPNETDGTTAGDGVQGINGATNTPITLENAMSQEQWYLENKMIIPKSQTVVFSRDVVFFYINRRQQTVEYGNIGRPYQFNALPVSFSGYESLNKYPVDCGTTIKVGGEDFSFKSAVCITESSVSIGSGNNAKQLIVGNTAVFQGQHGNASISQQENLMYDPQGAAEQTDRSPNVNTTFTHNDPVTILNGDANANMKTIVEKTGTICVYQKVKYENN
jgi:hypothetical protein